MKAEGLPVLCRMPSVKDPDLPSVGDLYRISALDLVRQPGDELLIQSEISSLRPCPYEDAEVLPAPLRRPMVSTKSVAEDEFEEVMAKLIMDPSITFTEAIAYPPLLIEILSSMLQEEPELHRVNSSLWDMDSDIIGPEGSITTLLNSINDILGTEKPLREQRQKVLDLLHDPSEPLDETELNLVLQLDFDPGLSVNSVIRKMFLADTNPDLIQKL